MKNILTAAVNRVERAAPMAKGRPIISFDYRDKQLQLFYADGKPVLKGDTIKHTREGEEESTYTITNAQAPHRPGTEGRVYVLAEGKTIENTYYVSVFDLQWKPAKVRLAEGEKQTANL